MDDDLPADALDPDVPAVERTDQERAEDHRGDDELPSEDDLDALVAGIDVDDIDQDGFGDEERVEPLEPAAPLEGGS
jgi:hypothetical protein